MERSDRGSQSTADQVGGVSRACCVSHVTLHRVFVNRYRQLDIVLMSKSMLWDHRGLFMSHITRVLQVGCLLQNRNGTRLLIS